MLLGFLSAEEKQNKQSFVLNQMMSSNPVFAY